MRDLTNIQDNIWLVTFDHAYDVAMHFVRVQEFYESPNSTFKGNKDFNLLDYMEWYAKDRDGVFTYPGDWGGFNIPGKVVDELYGHQGSFVIRDPNKYDHKMRTIVTFIKDLIGPNTPYYLIGTKYQVDESTLRHEVAHGLWHVREDYKKTQQIHTIKITLAGREIMKEELIKLGYAEDVIEDETHAYMIADPNEVMIKRFKEADLDIHKIRKSYIRTFDKYYNGPCK